jgi:DNA-binding NarL/FixJ family response regulator
VPQILIVDEHGVSRRGLRCLLEQRIRHARVWESADLATAFPLFQSEQFFDLVLINASNLDGHTRTTLIDTFGLPPTMRLAVLSALRCRTDVLTCLADGFHGFIDKQQADNEIVAAVTALIEGRIHVPTWVVDKEENGAPTDVVPPKQSTSLTPRQQSVLSLVAQGLSNKEIAHHLHISEGTTKIHTSALLKTLGVRNRAEAVAKAGFLLRKQPIQHEFEPAFAQLRSGPAAVAEPTTKLSNPKIRNFSN